MINPAALVLTDGSIFRGESVGAEGEVVGELVFYRSATGYQEALIDPAYAGKIVTFTTSHIGNTGINDQDNRFASIAPSAVVMRSLSLIPSHFRSRESFSALLRRRNIIALSGIDTRELSQRALSAGTLLSCIITGDYSDRELQQKAVQYFAERESTHLPHSLNLINYLVEA